jgi:malate synthase
VVAEARWSEAERQQEIDNNCRGILGYVVRWVDQQNAGDPVYKSLVANPDGAAYQAALELVFKGKEQPSGYTEPLLHAWRLKVKAAAGRA